jgi:calcineurin-like phosphoesterase family protein
VANIWFTSDTHFSHANVLKFTDDAGSLIRPGFFSVEEMDEFIIRQWNTVVRPGDKIYHLGDVTFGHENIGRIMARLTGQKRLIVGNHDDIPFLSKGGWFKKVQMWRIFKDFNFVASHVPLLPSSFRKVEFNVHGHIHEKPDPSPQHLNISVEKTNYSPLHVDEVMQLLRRKSGG